MMEAVGADWDGLLDDWRAGRAGTAELYGALRRPMHVAGRQGIAFITGQAPDPHDVEDAVFDAFKEMIKKDPWTVTSVIGLARTIAYRRGQDRGRAVVRRREQVQPVADPPAKEEDAILPAGEVELQAERERLFERATECLDQLTADQQDVIRATVMGREGLSDWAFRKGKTHQAASRQRDRALKALRRCIDQGDGD